MSEQVLEELYKKWAYGQLAIEIKQEEGGRVVADPDERSMQEYAIATVNKRRFVNYMTRCAYENKELTMQQLVKLVGCTRKAVETMLRELDGLDVIERGTNESGHNTYKGSAKMLKFHLNYSKWLFRSVVNTGIRNTATAILELENLPATPT